MSPPPAGSSADTCGVFTARSRVHTEINLFCCPYADVCTPEFAALRRVKERLHAKVWVESAEIVPQDGNIMLKNVGLKSA